MINFIIYEDDEKMANIYNFIIHRFMGDDNYNYNIYSFDKYSNDLIEMLNNGISGKKIYLLDVEVPGMSGIELAREIRNSGDWTSQIIIITAYDNYYCSVFTSRLLMLDFISKTKLKPCLMKSLNIALNILNKHASLSFKYNNEIFQILYSDIYYIEKNLNNNDATIVTKNDKYTIRCSINKLKELLKDDPRFFKCHRSCIVNLNNIVSFDLENNIIKFKNGQINLVSRGKKNELKERIINNNIKC